MPEFLKTEWPEGTTDKKGLNGKREIILPEPTNMNEFSRKKLSEKAKINRSITEDERMPINPQFSQNREKVRLTFYNEDEKIVTAMNKKYPRRQEQIVKNKRNERKFAERQDVAA
ncbi:MAG: hypothetical protein WC349_00770 [Patescibacteria group bacterium]|jgi:hypothetical protein